MIRVDAFRAGDLAEIAVQAEQTEVASVNRHALGAAYRAAGNCLTARDEGGTVLLCGGAAQTHAGYATLWSVLSPDAGRHMVPLTRATRRFIARLPHPRVDTIVNEGFAAGHRWVRLLGFKREAVLADYFPDGRNAVIYRLERC